STHAMKHDLRRTAAFYDKLVTEAHDDQEAVGWRTSYAQDVAFLTLARVEGLQNGSRILDVGCGLGALYGFFEKVGLKVVYTGIDISQKMIDGARQRHPDGKFELRDILRSPPRDRFDFVFCSGALAMTVANQPEYLQEMIATMYGLCDVAIAFNLLSAYAYVTRPQLQVEAKNVSYEWPSKILEFCKTQSEHVSLSHDTDSGTFSVYIYRRNRGALERYLRYVQPGTKYDRSTRAVIDYHIELELWEELLVFLKTLEPSPAVAFFLGQAYDGLGDVVNAETSFKLAIADGPTVPWPYIRMGFMFSRLGDADRAIEAARTAVSVAPDEPAAHECLVKILYANRMIDEARAAALVMPEGPLGDTTRAVVAETPDHALASLDRALAAAPQYLPALIARADALEKLGRSEEALATWKTAQSVAPIDRSIADRIANLVRKR
ncbi:MAG TPA: methyltransferase domain-containing protein, partial [Kofleriaceae bacterium]